MNPPRPLTPEELTDMAIDAATALGAPRFTDEHRARLLEHAHHAAEAQAARHVTTADLLNVSAEELRELQGRARARRAQERRQLALRNRLAGGTR